MSVGEIMGERLPRAGTGMLRWSLVLFLVAFGLYKFMLQETAGVEPLMRRSPFSFWVNPLFGQQGGSNVIGVIEIIFAVLIALRHVRPLLSAYGALATAGAPVIVIRLLFTTRGLTTDAGFLLQDLTLEGAALFVGAMAFLAARRRAPGR